MIDIPPAPHGSKERYPLPFQRTGSYRGIRDTVPGRNGSSHGCHHEKAQPLLLGRWLHTCYWLLHEGYHFSMLLPPRPGFHAPCAMNPVLSFQMLEWGVHPPLRDGLFVLSNRRTPDDNLIVHELLILGGILSREIL